MIHTNCRSRGKLIVVSTHDSRLLGKTDHLIMLNGEGRVGSSGRPEDVMKEMKEDEENLNQREEKSDGEEETHEYVVAMEEEKMVRIDIFVLLNHFVVKNLRFSIILVIVGRSSEEISIQIIHGRDWSIPRILHYHGYYWNADIQEYRGLVADQVSITLFYLN